MDDSAKRDPVVEDARLQECHHCLIAPNAVADAHRRPAPSMPPVSLKNPIMACTDERQPNFSCRLHSVLICSAGVCLWLG